MTIYRTRTYLAADWTGDEDAIKELHKWNDSKHWGLSFTDAHDLMQANDTSLNCTIKDSLRKRIQASKTFVLIVGNQTRGLRSGSCQYCNRYNSWTQHCAKGYTVDYRSYVDYECDKSIEDGIKLVILYNATSVDKSKCPEVLKNIGIHVSMLHYEGGKKEWDYLAVKEAIEN